MEEKPRYWFAAKRSGYGWTWPLTWEGWAAYGVWFGTFFIAFPFIHPEERPIRALSIVIGMIIPLAALCYWKGEPQRGNQPN